MTRPVTEWVNVTDDISIIARESGEVWFHNRSSTKGGLDPFAAPMEGPGSLGSTIGLLDGAINLAFSTIEEPLCKRFDDLCAEDYPIGSIGYSYCLERIAALKEDSDIDNVRALCPEGVDATRFLRSHSSLGSEAAHVDETIEFVASLPANDRIKVVQETYRSALIMAEGYNNELLKSEAQMREEMERALGEPLPYLHMTGLSGVQKHDVASARAD